MSLAAENFNQMLTSLHQQFPTSCGNSPVLREIDSSASWSIVAFAASLRAITRFYTYLSTLCLGDRGWAERSS
jgi:hypothetical protein